jgi:hypothetical protein
VGETSPEIIAKEMKRKKTTDISIAAPPFLFTFLKFKFFIIDNYPLKQLYRKNLDYDLTHHHLP